MISTCSSSVRPASCRAVYTLRIIRQLPLRVLDSDLRQAFPFFLEVADFHQRRPQLNRPLDDTDDVVHNSQQVLLEEVRLETVEGLIQICGEQAQRLAPRRVGRGLGSL